MVEVATDTRALDELLEKDIIDYLNENVTDKPDGGFRHHDEDNFTDTGDYCTVTATIIDGEPFGPTSGWREVELMVEHNKGEVAEEDARAFGKKRREISEALFGITADDLTVAGSHGVIKHISFNDSDERDFDGDIRVFRRSFTVYAGLIDPTSTSS